MHATILSNCFSHINLLDSGDMTNEEKNLGEPIFDDELSSTI